MNFTAENVDLRIFLDICSRDWGEQIEENLKKIAVTQKQWVCNHMSRSKWPLHSSAHCIHLLHYSVTTYGTCVLLKLHVILGYIYIKKKKKKVLFFYYLTF